MPGRTIIEASIEKDIKPKTNLTKCVNVNDVPKIVFIIFSSGNILRSLNAIK